MKKRMLFLLLIVSLMLLGSITVQAETFTLSKNKVTLNIGDSTELTVNGTEAQPRWASYQVNIARVDQKGKITALRKGTTTISARIGLTYRKCTVTVVEPTIKLNKTSAVIYTGGTSVNTVQLKATAKGASKTVEWGSLNPGVATVDNTGKVTAVAPGTAVIYAKANGKMAGCPITVKESSITLNLSSMQLSTKGNGSSIKLIPAIIGSGKTVKWTTSDKTVATVSGGKVTGKNTGHATITATANGVSASCEVQVIKDSISINEEQLLLYSGETKPLKTNAGKKDVVAWSSSDKNVVTVDETGKVTAVGAGMATIYASLNGTEDGCRVVVRNTATDILESDIALKTKGADKTYTILCQVIGRNPSIKWTSSNPKVVAVSKGKLTAKAEGTATITAIANGIQDTVQVTVSAYDPTITLNQTDYTLYTVKGNTYTLKAAIDGPVKKAVWESENPGIATVVNGKVIALTEGQTRIRASANGVTAECLLTVRESKVLPETTSITLNKGETASLPADVVGVSQTLKYTSTNSKIVTVKNGILTAKNYGEADIRITANGVTAVCHVKVALCKHSYDEGVITKEATCTEPGIRTYTCTLCGDSYTEVIPLKEHEYNQVTVTEPTCMEQGYTLHTCICGDSYTDDFRDALGHDFGEWVITKEPTETEKGEQKRICTRILTGNPCSAEEIEELPVKAHEHQYSAVVTDPTCTEQGYTTWTCRCGDRYVDTYVDALGHAFGEWVITKEPTETEKGEQKRTCTRIFNGEPCSAEEIEELPVKAHEHQYSAVVTDPTCTEQGYTTWTCRCGDQYVDTYVDALGHTFGEWVITKEASEFTEGEKKRSCIRCGLEETEEIPKLEHIHQYFKIVIEPTCTEQGYDWHCCPCGEVYTDHYVDALGHAFGDWVVTKEPTETEEGEKQRSCTRIFKEVKCDGVETEKIPAKGHTHTYTTMVHPETCTTPGYITYTCSTCGDTYQKIISEPSGHDYQWDISKKPTCTTEGIKVLRCSRCRDIKETHSIAAAHSWEDWSVIKAPAEGAHTTTEDFGTQVRTCSACGETEECQVIHIDLGEGNTETLYGTFEAQEATQALALVNELRISKGLNKLEWEPQLEDTAKLRSAELSHTYSSIRPDGSKTALSLEDVLEFAENMGSSYTTAKQQFDSWKNTSSVYDSMLSASANRYYCACFKGITQDQESGEYRYQYYWIQLVVTVDTSCKHTYTDTITAPTCTEKGYTTHTCSKCQESYVDTYVDALGHDYTNQVTEPTCTERGYTTHTCSRCSYSYVDTYVAAAGHQYQEKVIEPTCTEQGYTLHTCRVCKDSYQDTQTPALGHDYKAVVTEPTCAEQGYTTHTCSRCQDCYVDSYTEATGQHDEGEWVTTKEPQVGVPGEKELQCTKCGYVLDTAEIEMLLTDGVDSVYYFTNRVVDEDGNAEFRQEMAVGHYNEEEAQEMLELVNAYRTSIDMPTFEMTSSTINEYAATRAVETSYLWDHMRPLGAKTLYSENIAMGIIDLKGNPSSVQEIFDAWLNSPGHKQNLDSEKRFNITGISVFYKKLPVLKDGVETGRYVYQPFWVEVFR